MTDPVNVPSPARVSTVEELDALPVGSVVGSTLRSVLTAAVLGDLGWAITDQIGPYSSSQVLAALGSATILYRPDRALFAEAEARGAEREQRHVADKVAEKRANLWRAGCDNGAGAPLDKPWDTTVLAVCDVLDDVEAYIRSRAAEAGGQA